MMLLERAYKHYDFSRTENQPIPALEISKIVLESTETRERISNQEADTLEYGIRFLNRAIRGLSHLDDLINKGILTGDYAALDAYDQSQRAVSGCDTCNKYDDPEILLSLMRSVLTSLVSTSKLDTDFSSWTPPSADDLGVTAEFFKHLASIKPDSESE